MNAPEKRAVAFLDIMGFKKLIEQAEKQRSMLEKFHGLKHVIESHVTRDNDRLAPSVPPHVKPNYLFVSDSIILSAPLQSDGFDGLVVVSIKSIEIAHKLLEMGFLLRGGIAIGNVWHEPKNIFGTGYIEAYQLEESVKPPRIVLSKTATSHLREATHYNVPLNELGLWQKTKHYVYLDALNPSYIRGIESHGRIEQAFSQYRAYIYNALQDAELSGGVRKKWDATRVQFNYAVKQHRVNVEPIPKPSPNYAAIRCS